MPITHEHVGSKKPAKINTFMLTRAELLITLCYEIPCKLEPHVSHLSALSLLRQFTIDEKHIEERDDQIIFNDLSWNKDSLTNFMISSSKAG